MADSVGEMASPNTCKDWVDAHIKVHDTIVKHKVRGFLGKSLAGGKIQSTHAPQQPPYLLNWMVRGIRLLSMRRDGVRRLSRTGDVSVAEFAVAFPDACSWFEILPTETCRSSLKDFFKSLEYDGPPELFSFWSCLLLSRPCLRSKEWFHENTKAIRQLQQRYRRQHGIDLVPSRCCMLIANGTDRVESEKRE